MNKCAIICVDDESIILESLKQQLKKHFLTTYIYELASSAEEAMEILDELILDGVMVLIIVSDWLMPGIRGDDFLIEVHKRYPQIIKVMLTGQADDESIQKARDSANLYACLSKPWNENELIEIIKKGLDKNE